MASSYGTDISTFAGTSGPDIDPLMPIISGERVVLEACARRLMTPRGFFESLPDYGYDLSSKLGMRLSAVARERISADIVTEVKKDERVLGATVTEFTDLGSGAWRIRVSIRLATGPFNLVLNADAVNVTLLSADKG